MVVVVVVEEQEVLLTGTTEAMDIMFEHYPLSHATQAKRPQERLQRPPLLLFLLPLPPFPSHSELTSFASSIPPIGQLLNLKQRLNRTLKRQKSIP